MNMQWKNLADIHHLSIIYQHWHTWVHVKEYIYELGCPASFLVIISLFTRYSSSHPISFLFFLSFASYKNKTVYFLSLHAFREIYELMAYPYMYIKEIENMYPVSIELKKHEGKSGRTTNAVGTPANRQVFPRLFWGLPNFHNCFNNSVETRRIIMFSISFLENSSTRQKNQLVYIEHQNVNSLRLHHHYVNSSC